MVLIIGKTYRKAWNALEKGGLTSYANSTENDLIVIRACTLIMIYMEFCDLVFGEDCAYCFSYCAEDLGIGIFRMGQIVGRFYPDEDFSWFNEEEYGLDSVFKELVFNERYAVVDCLINNIGEYKEATAYVAMYLDTVALRWNILGRNRRTDGYGSYFPTKNKWYSYQ